METITEQPNSTIPFLRWIVTVPYYRKAVEPVYKVHPKATKEWVNGTIIWRDRHEFIGSHTTNQSIQTRLVVGFGETQQEAQAMANKKAIQ